MYVTPATWFPSSHIHSAWLTEAALLMVGLAVLAILVSFTAESRGKLTLRNALIASAVGCLVMAAVLWFGPLNDYPNDQLNAGYWAQHYYIGKMLGAVLRHMGAAVGLSTIPMMLGWTHDEWRFGRRDFGLWLVTILGVLGGFTLVAGALLLNF